jgi:spore germination cell wall hydrolase CwlJ-like protein
MEETNMDAVAIFDKIEQYFDRHHNVFMRFGSLFAAIFFMVYVPYNMVSRIEDQLQAQQNVSIVLASQLQDMSAKMQFLELSYDDKKKVMREVECLAQNIYFEAGSESTAGKIAVATVTLNRLREGYAKTICGVVKQKHNGICQFSWVCEKNKIIRSRSNYKEAVMIAENILISKRSYGTMENALYFHADYVNPSWARTKDFVKKIGRHLFYKEG